LIAHEVFQKGKPPTLIEYLASKVAVAKPIGFAISGAIPENTSFSG